MSPKEIAVWKRKKVEVEERIRKLEEIKYQTSEWLRRTSQKSVDYQQFSEKNHNRLINIIRGTAQKLEKAKQNLEFINEEIKERKIKQITTVSISALLVLMVIFGLGTFFLDEPTITGMAVNKTLSETGVDKIVINEAAPPTTINESDMSQIIENQTVSPDNKTTENETIIDKTVIQENAINQTWRNETIVEEQAEDKLVIEESKEQEIISTETITTSTITTDVVTGIHIQTIRKGIRISEPVQWIKNISLNVPQNVTIELPFRATNITITTVQDDREEPVVESSSEITGGVVYHDERSEFHFFLWLKKLWGQLTRGITGAVISEGSPPEIIKITLESNATGYKIEYYTEAPQSREEITARGKLVTISAPDDLNYTNVIAFTTLNNKIPIDHKEQLKLYWYNYEWENSGVRKEGYVLQDVPFDAHDTDNDGKIDYIEWIVPHLSNQTYGIIEITNAEHLDEQREFISDIFDQVKALDGVWSEAIPEQHYVRVTFEQKLTNRNDITLFPRTVNGSPRIEVYEINSSDKIAEFTSLDNNAYNRVILTGLEGSQDVFDLLVLDGGIELDHIIDPDPPNVTNITPILNSRFNITNVIEIGVNVTDSDGVSLVLANITFPNSSVFLYNLSNSADRPNWYNISFLIPELTGLYNVSLVANDSGNIYNRTEFTNFTVNVGCANITRNTDLDQDVTAAGNCFGITRSNIILNGSGYTIRYGTAATGIGINLSSGVKNVTIKNTYIVKGSQTSNANYGISLGGSNDNTTISNNTIKTNGTSNNHGVVSNLQNKEIKIYNNYISTDGTTINHNAITIASQVITSEGESSIQNNTLIAGGSSSGTFNTLIVFNGFRSNYFIFNNTLIQRAGSSGNSGAIDFFSSASNMKIISNNITFVASSGIYMASGVNNTWVENNIININGSNTVGIQITGNSWNNTFLNNNISSSVRNPLFTIYDLTSESYNNSIIYNNTFGEIRWIDNESGGSFVRNLTLNITNNLGIGLDRNLFIANNTIGVNTSAFGIGNGGRGRINGTVNMTLVGINNTYVTEIAMLHDYNLSINFSMVQSGGVKCLTCSNISYIGNTLKFNATGLGVFSANDSTATAGGANSRPTAPVTSLPTNGSTTTNRTGVFSWFNSSDADGDIFSYHLQIDDNARFNNPEVNISAIPTSNANTSATYYFSTTELAVDTTYFWRVRANDSGGFGDWSNGAAVDGPSDASNRSNFTLNSLLEIVFTNNVIEFGTLTLGDVVNTSDQVPLPFRVENIGNIFVNVTINATRFFTSGAFPSSNYNFKIRENESAAFNLSQSQLQWVFMPKVNSTVHVAELNWRDAQNDFLVDINVTIPDDEPAGDKSSNITFTVTGSNLG